MCGIFGLINIEGLSRGDLVKVLIRGLRRLEYRGYDSAGIAFNRTASHDSAPKDPATGTPLSESTVIIKARGNVNRLAELCETTPALSDCADLATPIIALAHTRWATHGEPCDRNAHPHTSDPTGLFTAVHNGIITNHSELRLLLDKHGFSAATATSDTDTEVIVRLMLWVYTQHVSDNAGVAPSFPHLVGEVMRMIDGAYSFLFASPLYPGELIACKVGSPLIISVVPKGSALISADEIAVATADAEGAACGHAHALQDIPFTPPRERAEPTVGSAFIISSDAAAIVEHTRNVRTLTDGDIAHFKVTGRGDAAAAELFLYHTSSLTQPRDVTFERLTLELDAIAKGAYEHFMLKEISEQPESLRTTMAGRVVPSTAAAVPPATSPTVVTAPPPMTPSGGASGYYRRVVLGGIAPHVDAIRRSRRLMFIACGTSYHSCLATRNIFEQVARIPVVVEVASDFLDRRPPVYRDDTCIFVSQSGETADTLYALEYCRARGALLVGLTNVVGSAISRKTDCGVHLNAGAEIGVASTKAYTSQLVVLLMLSVVLAEDRVSARADCEAIADALLSLPAAFEWMMRPENLPADVLRIIPRLADAPGVLILGRGADFATALEGALKIKEISYIMAEGIQAGELKHGPLALVDERASIIIVAADGATHTAAAAASPTKATGNLREQAAVLMDKTKLCLEQVVARKGRPIVVTHPDTELPQRFAADCDRMNVPRVHPAVQAVVNVVPFQLLSYHLAVAKGLNVDCPRNLAKSVTVTEH